MGLAIISDSFGRFRAVPRPIPLARIMAVSMAVLVLAVVPGGTGHALASHPAHGAAVVPTAGNPSIWPVLGHDAGATNFNGDERAIGASTVSRLHRVWSLPNVNVGWGMYAIAGPGAAYVFLRQLSMAVPTVVVALDPRTGRRLHMFGPKELGLTGAFFRSMPDQPTAMAYANGTLLVANLGEIVALDPSTGRRKWLLSGGSLFVTVAGNVVYTSNKAINLTSGRVLWINGGGSGGSLLTAGYLYQYPVGSPSTAGAPIYRPANGSLAGTLPPGSMPEAGTGNALYTVRYVGVGSPRYRLEIERRTPLGALQWRHQAPSHCQSASLALAYATVYVVCQTGISDGTLQALQMGNGRVRWSVKLSDLSPFPLVANGLVFVGAQHGVSILDAATGRLVRHINVGHIGVRALMLAGGTLYVLDGSTLIAYHT